MNRQDEDGMLDVYEHAPINGEDISKRMYGGCFSLVFILLCFISLCIFASCKTITETQYVSKHDTCYVSTLQRDSIYLHDSIFEKEYLRGDTIVLYKYVQTSRWREKILHDTCYVSKSDTIRVRDVVEKKPGVWQTIKNKISSLILSIACAIALLIFVLWKLKKG